MAFINLLRLSDAIIGSDDEWLVAWSAPSHYLNQCRNIVNWTLRNKFQVNLNQNSYIFIQENVFENIVYEMAAILSLPQSVKPIHCDKLSTIHLYW